ncbi:hypothetical protein Csa_022890 [Cucumis sativus]|uniref:Uncharacterized protein n=1 Tax=Cucumis sativus TaxID=3659 RepID=A0A0A0LT13_CUCSA|nr:hypothetical protein Csa_022890 [Cucumis sativus]
MEIKAITPYESYQEGLTLAVWCPKTSELVELNLKRYRHTSLKPIRVWITAAKTLRPSQKCCCKKPRRRKRDAQLVVLVGVSNGEKTMLRKPRRSGSESCSQCKSGCRLNVERRRLQSWAFAWVWAPVVACLTPVVPECRRRSRLRYGVRALFDERGGRWTFPFFPKS